VLWAVILGRIHVSLLVGDRSSSDVGDGLALIHFDQGGATAAARIVRGTDGKFQHLLILPIYLAYNTQGQLVYYCENVMKLSTSCLILKILVLLTSIVSGAAKL